MSAAQKKLIEASAAVETARAQAQSDRESSQTAEQKCAMLNTHLQSVRASSDGTEQELQLARGELQALRQQLVQSASVVQSSAEEVEHAQNLAKAAEAAVANREQQLKALRENAAQAETLRSKARDERAEELSAHLGTQKAETDTLKQEIDSLAGALEEAQSSLLGVHQRQMEGSLEVETLQSQVEQASARESQLQESLRQKDTVVATLAKQAEAAVQTLGDCEKRHNEAHQQLASAILQRADSMEGVSAVKGKLESELAALRTEKGQLVKRLRECEAAVVEAAEHADANSKLKASVKKKSAQVRALSLPFVSTAFVAETVPLPCGPQVKSLRDFHRKNDSVLGETKSLLKSVMARMDQAVGNQERIADRDKLHQMVHTIMEKYEGLVQEAVVKHPRSAIESSIYFLSRFIAD